MIGRAFENDPDETAEEKEDELVDYDMGEGFEFNAIEVTRTLFKAFGLTEEASKRAIDLGLSSDRAQLTNTIVSHVATGLKFNDVAVSDPFSKCLAAAGFLTDPCTVARIFSGGVKASNDAIVSMLAALDSDASAFARTVTSTPRGHRFNSC